MPHADLAEHHIQDLLSLDVVAHSVRAAVRGSNPLAPTNLSKSKVDLIYAILTLAISLIIMSIYSIFGVKT